MSRRWLQVFLGALILSVAADYLMLRGEGHGEFWWASIWGFFALSGFIGCLALILVSKALGHYWLERGEDYYEADDRDG